MESDTTTEIPSETGDKKQVRLVDVPVTSPQEALQLIVTFLNLAQRRGVFTLDESAKIWDCIKQFQINK